MTDFEELDSKASHGREILNSWMRCVSTTFPHGDLTPFVNARIPNTSLLAGYLIIAFLPLDILLFQKNKVLSILLPSLVSKHWLSKRLRQIMPRNISTTWLEHSVLNYTNSRDVDWSLGNPPQVFFNLGHKKLNFCYKISFGSLITTCREDSFVWRCGSRPMLRSCLPQTQFHGANALIDIVIQRPSRIKELKNSKNN